MPTFIRLSNAFGAALLAFAAIAAAAQQQSTLDAPNVVEISPQLVTSGQPTKEALGRLAAQGFGAVIYLAPPTVMDAVRDEALIVARQGLVYVNIPIRFDEPKAEDFEAFAGTLGALAGRKVLVHCQVNMRASSMVFLYRSIVAKDDPRIAYESVTKVWVPHGPWKQLIEEQLRTHKIAFEPF